MLLGDETLATQKTAEAVNAYQNARRRLIISSKSNVGGSAKIEQEVDGYIVMLQATLQLGKINTRMRADRRREKNAAKSELRKAIVARSSRDELEILILEHLVNERIDWDDANRGNNR